MIKGDQLHPFSCESLKWSMYIAYDSSEKAASICATILELLWICNPQLLILFPLNGWTKFCASGKNFWKEPVTHWLANNRLRMGTLGSRKSFISIMCYLDICDSYSQNGFKYSFIHVDVIKINIRNCSYLKQNLLIWKCHIPWSQPTTKYTILILDKWKLVLNIHLI